MARPEPTVALMVRIRPELADWLAAEAQRTGTSQRAIVERLLEWARKNA